MTSSPPSPHGPVCDHEGCITCGDTALPLTVRNVDAERALALCVDERGASESVQTELVGAVAPGDELLVHAGTAIQRL
jgi:hydrogenase maturation factor